MERAAVCIHPVHRLGELGVLEELAVLYSLVYRGYILIHHSARAYVKVSYFAVTHLTRGKSDGASARLDERVRIFRHEPVEVGCSRRGNGVSALFLAVSEPVHDYYSMRLHDLSVPARQTAAPLL